MDIHPLASTEYPELLAFIQQYEEADAQLFLINALRQAAPQLQVYAQRDEQQRLLGAVALLPNLPPFAVPVVLVAGRASSALLAYTAARHTSPQMAVGPKSALEHLLVCWPSTWLAPIGRRDEVLLKQFEASPVRFKSDLTTRLASPQDESTLVQYRLQMEKDSGVKLLSTREQACHTVRQLTARQALYVIEVGGQLAGCTAITSQDEQHEQLGFVFVEARHRLRGVSDALLNDVCTAIHRRQRKPLTFTCVGGPLRHRLGEIGFRQVGEHLKLYFG